MNNNQDEINKLFSKAVQDIEKIDEEEEEHKRVIVIKCINAIKDDVPREQIPFIIASQIKGYDISERFVHECMAKIKI